MDQLIYASLSHTHYWYEVGILKSIAHDGAAAVGKITFCSFASRYTINDSCVKGGLPREVAQEAMVPTNAFHGV